MRTHYCHAQGCVREVEMDRFMCQRHWKLAPLDLRDALMDAWNRAGRNGAQALASEDWHQAADALVAAVADIERGQIERGEAARCPECQTVVRVAKKGTLFNHGPRRDRCPRSGRAP